MEFYRKMKRIHAPSFSIVDNITIIILFLVLCLFTMTFTDISNITLLVNDIFRNWSESPIDIVQIRKGKVCPRGWETILTEKYPGTYEGCYCRLIREDGYMPETIFEKEDKKRLSSNGYTTSSKPIVSDSQEQKEEVYMRGKCKKMENYTCNAIKSSKKIPLRVYKHKGYCARRSEFNYFDLYKNVGLTDCKKGYKDCGVIDNMGNVMCILKKLQCPYYDLRWVEKKPKKKQLIFTNKQYKFIKLTNGTFLFFAKNRTTDPIKAVKQRKTARKTESKSGNYYNERRIFIDFKVNSVRPCIFPNEENKEKNYNLLLKDYTGKRCSFMGKLQYDKRYKKIDSLKKLKWYFENNVTLPIGLFYLQNPRTKTFIYSRPYIGIRYDCLNDEINPDIFKATFDKMFIAITYYPYIGITTLSCLISQLILNFAKKRTDGDDGDFLLYSYFLIEILIMLSSGATGVVSIITCMCVSNAMIFTDKFTSLNCGDEYTMPVIEGFREFSEASSIISLVISILLIVGSSLNPANFLANSLRSKR